MANARTWRLVFDRFNPAIKAKEGKAAFRLGVLIGGLWIFNELAIEPFIAFTIASDLGRPYLAIVLYPFIHLEYVAVPLVLAIARLRRWL